MGKFENLKTGKNLKRIMLRHLLGWLLLSTVNCQLSSAQVSATLRADSTQIWIGDFLNVRLTIRHPAHLQVPFPAIKDSLGNLEMVSASKIDTTSEAGQQVLSQLYTVSAYDPGDYQAGPVKVFFTNSSGTTDSVIADFIPVRVNTLEVDTAKPFKAIKAPLAVPYSWREFTYYIIAGLVLLLLLIAAIVVWKKYKKQKPAVEPRPKPKDPAHLWARKELKKLEEEKLWQQNEVKHYYSRLTDILRLYLEYRYGWLALESTTEEIESEMEQYHLKEKAKESLLSVLRAADLVKFAKMIPLPDANIRAMEHAYKLIEFTEPKEVAEPKK